MGYGVGAFSYFCGYVRDRDNVVHVKSGVSVLFFLFLILFFIFWFGNN